MCTFRISLTCNISLNQPLCLDLQVFVDGLDGEGLGGAEDGLDAVAVEFLGNQPLVVDKLGGDGLFDDARK